MAISFKLPDDSAQNKRRMIAASGGYATANTSPAKERQYPKSDSLRFSITKKCPICWLSSISHHDTTYVLLTIAYTPKLADRKQAKRSLSMELP